METLGRAACMGRKGPSGEGSENAVWGLKGGGVYMYKLWHEVSAYLHLSGTDLRSPNINCHRCLPFPAALSLRIGYIRHLYT